MSERLSASRPACESHRLHEALALGSIPIVQEAAGILVPWTAHNPLPWVKGPDVQGWTQLDALASELLQLSPAQLDALQRAVLEWYRCGPFL